MLQDSRIRGGPSSCIVDYVLNIVQKALDTIIYLKVEQEQGRVAQEIKGQASG